MECSGRAVWPPLGGAQKWVYNPLIALRKMATRDAFAGDEAQAHLQALMDIVSREFHMPRPLTHGDKPIQQTTSSSTTPSSRSATSSSSSSSATSTLALTTPRNVTTPAPAKPTQQTPGGKRRERPDPSPTATPSPKPKSGRQSEHDITAQASQQQPATTSNIQPATTSNIQQPETNNQEESDESEEETEETTQETELTQATTRNAQQEQPERKEVEVQPTTNNFKMRDFHLQERVRDGGGRSIINDPNNQYKQYRYTTSGHEWQLSVGHHDGCGCLLFLYEWETNEQFKCQGGRGKVKRRGNAQPNAYMEWRCEQHGTEICLTCIPVVVRTLDWDLVEKCYRK